MAQLLIKFDKLLTSYLANKNSFQATPQMHSTVLAQRVHTHTCTKQLELIPVQSNIAIS